MTAQDYDSQLLESVSVRRRRLRDAVVFGTQRQRRSVDERLGKVFAGIVVAAVLCAGCVGESASGAIVLAAFGEQLSRAVPLAVSAEIAYRKLAMGPVTATATLGRPAADVVAELDAGQRPEFPVTVAIRRADGAVTGEMTVVWTLRPNG
ncbi:DUF4442 domain-containing protein [Streptomyces sp. NPDC047990]|uniref:DUF4442 domain-containing protein n=1 Tax=Streptomyces sp. NPDC047990 TaxID=3365496 RepID=UPI003717958F